MKKASERYADRAVEAEKSPDIKMRNERPSDNRIPRPFLPVALLLALACLTGLFSVPAASRTDEPFYTGQELYDALYDAGIAELKEAVMCGFLSPVTLTEYYFDRIEKYNETWNCFVTLSKEDALAAAREKEEEIRNGSAEGALFGIPVVVKDNIDVKGLPTTNGYALKSSSTYTAKENAYIVQRMIDEGAIIIGKANMSAGAEATRITYGWEVGETFNAYDPKMASGGSSGGSAVAVSLNFAAAGLGTDTGSSLRIPAVLNGCVTLRASRGLISKDGIVLLNKYRDTPGAITRNVDDLAVMLDVITDGSEDFAGALDGDALKGIRIGILKELTYATTLIGGRTKSHLDGEVQDTFAKTVEEMKSLGAEIVTVSIPNLFTLYNNAKDDSSSNVKKFRSTVESTLKNNGLSALIFPTYLNTPQETGYESDGTRKIDSQDWLNNTIYVSPPTGCPEMGVTIGYHSRGPGIGMEILGATGSDRTLLGIAYAYTEAYNKREFPTNNGQPENAKYSLSELTYLYLHPEARPQTAETETTPADTSIPDSAQSSRVVTSADITDVLTGGELTPDRGETVSRVLLVFVTAIAVIVLVLYIVRQINIRKNRRRAAARKKSRRKQ